MKIAFLTHEPFFPPSGGGSAEAVYLVRELVRRGHALHIFCPVLKDKAAVETDFQVVVHEFTTWEMGRYTSLRNFKYLAYPFFLQRLVASHAQTVRFDLVLSQHAISAVAAGRLKRQLGVPVVMNFLDYLTGFMETWPPWLAPPPLLAQLKRFELNIPKKYHADAVLTVSDTLGDYFAGTGYPRDQIRPIYYGYDAALFPFRGSSPPDTQNPVIVMHGSLDHHHLREIGLGAMKMILEKRPDAVFRFVGHRTGALAAFLQKAEKQMPSAKVECTGFVPYPEVAAHLATAHVGIVPYEESTGTHCAFVAKIVEYLGVGLPVVSTPLKSAMRYFKDEPMVRFSKFDGASFGQSVLDTLAHPLPNQDQLARQASDRVKANLDWLRLSERAADFIEQKVSR